MSKRVLAMGTVCGCVLAIVAAGCEGIGIQAQEREETLPGEGFAAVPGLKGGHDIREWVLDDVRNRFASPMDIHNIIVTSDRKLWAAHRGIQKIMGYDLEGNYLYSWGSFGAYPGGCWGVHGIATDQRGNFYTASVGNGRIQKFVPREGANAEFLVGTPWPSVW